MVKAGSEQTLDKDDGLLEDGLTTNNEKSRGGGWNTFPFLIGSTVTQTMASKGVVSNLVVFLIQKFNIQKLDAAQIANIIIGCIHLAPIAGAIAADSFFGCFRVISSCSLICFLGLIMLTLISVLPSLQPPFCAHGIEKCVRASKGQLAVLFTSLALVAVGVGGTRFNAATFGANQFKNAKNRESFINWFVFSINLGYLAAASLVVYVQDNVGWGWGYGLCVMVNVISFVVLILGRNSYCHIIPQGSPFTCLARVVVASVKKRRAVLSTKEDDYYGSLKKRTPSESYRFFNRAALISDGNTDSNGSLAEKQWRLCTVEQVEDLKTIVKLLPIWSTSFLVNTPVAILSNLKILQALTMDRHLGPHFAIPAGSFIVFVLFTCTVTVTFLDRFLYPACRKLTNRQPSPLQRIGVGHVLVIAVMVASALVEKRRLVAIHEHGLAEQPYATVPISAMWLVVPLTLMGMAESFLFPGHVGFFYQEFPESLRSTATAMSTVTFGVAFYLSAASIDVFRRVSDWLPENVNQARLDNVYWVMAGLGFVNFGFYLVCAGLYRYKETD